MNPDSGSGGQRIFDWVAIHHGGSSSTESIWRRIPSIKLRNLRQIDHPDLQLPPTQDFPASLRFSHGFRISSIAGLNDDFLFAPAGHSDTKLERQHLANLPCRSDL